MKWYQVLMTCRMRVETDPLGITLQRTEISSLTRWSQLPPATNMADYSNCGETAAHAVSPFQYNPTVNHRIILWSGDISELCVDAVVNTTNESMSERNPTSNRIYARAGYGLKEDICNKIKECKTGSVVVTQGYNLHARFIIHTVGPNYNIKYQTAADNTLYSCYRNVLQKARELNVKSLALCVINSIRRNFPPDRGAHIALRTVRRFLEQSTCTRLETVVLVVENLDVGIYEVLLPLYFPRSPSEEVQACWLLPADVGGPSGEPLIPDRQIRIIDNPQHALNGEFDVHVECKKHLAGRKGDAPLQLEPIVGVIALTDTSTDTSFHIGEEAPVSFGLGLGLGSITSVGEHAFSQMQGDLDQQRLLGERPVAAGGDPLAQVMLREIQTKERYERLLRRARTEDLTEVSGIGCLYQSGVDRFGRPIVVFVGKWFRFKEVNLDKALLYLIYLLDPLVKSDYVIAYFHSLTSAPNYPSFAWLKEVYNILPYKYKKNLKACYVVHPTFWTKMMTWWFTTFMAPAIKNKVHNLPGVEFLYSTISQDELEIPAFITEHDMTINGLHYFHPDQPA